MFITRKRRWLILSLVSVTLFMLGADDSEPAVESAPQNSTVKLERLAHYLSVSVPITSAVDLNVRRAIDEIVSESESNRSRPILVLEFRPKGTGNGEGTEVAQAFSLARYLISDRLNGIRTVAYLPNSVRGHAVLPILACEDIVMAPDAEFGDAGLDESSVDQTVRRLYSDIAEKRRTVPTAVVLGMLDRTLTVYRVQTVDGTVRYALQDELDQLQEKGVVTDKETIVRPGELGRFSGRELRLKYGFVSHLAENRGQLATALQLPIQSLEEDPSRGKAWKAIRFDLTGPIHSKSINWVERSLRDGLSNGEVNFVCVVLDSPGGSVTDSLRFANYLASLPAGEVRTVAYVSGNARADAALIALACDHLVVTEDAVLGGEGDAVIEERDLPSLRESVKSFANAKQINWSLPVALVDPSLAIHRYTRKGTNEVRLLCEDELSTLDNSETWQRGAEMDVRHGMSGRTAEELRVARYQATNFDELSQIYHLDDSLQSIKPNWAHMLVEHLASPHFSGLLLFVAWFALVVEFMSPGISVAGFLSGLCFLLYFWANYLHGTAGWLEILLFVVGAGCVLLEFFVVPGVGVFGLGGGLMMVTSIILASQTFVIPRNSYQLGQLPNSLFMVVAAGAGAILSVALMRRILPDTPVLNRIMMSPPTEEQRIDLERRESIVDYSHLVGQEGEATTRLLPGGKALIAGEYVDVLTVGEVLEAGARIRVEEVRGNHILVRSVG